MDNFNKNEQATRFFVDGKGCIKDARFLYDNDNLSHYYILLIHGIELSLKSYIFFKDPRSQGDVMKDIKSKPVAHDYKGLYEKCLKLGRELDDKDLRDRIYYLSDFFYSDTIDARYIEAPGLRSFPIDTFKVLDIHLINPIERLTFSILRDAS